MEARELIEEYKRIRKSLKISQKNIVKEIGVSKYTVSKAESGRHTPKLKTFVEMARSIGYTLILVPLYDGTKRVEPIKAEKLVQEPEEVDYDNWIYDED